ncbi:MAG TPA: hypothetical protein VGN17_23425 [Bryobacteraceae bacterium]|jgi:hypothetical protein
MHEYEHKLPHHDATEGFDDTEPEAAPIWAFTVGSVLVLVLVIWSLQQYFEKVWNDAVYENVLAPTSQQLEGVRNRDEWALTHYQYQEPTKKQVRIPIDRAEELFLQESAAGKTFYPAKPTVPKKEEPDTPAPGAAATGAAAPGATPAAPATKK